MAALGWRVVILAAGVGACAAPGIRKFPDRPVAWHEHDDGPVKGTPEGSRTFPWTDTVEDSIAREIDRTLALEPTRPAEDVNALDEVPCSTWFCPKNHLSPMSPEAIAAGPPGAGPPEPPYRIVEGKTGGASIGFVVEDARGRRWLFKVDTAPYRGMASGAEAVSTRLIHAAGWYVPAAYVVDVADADLRIDPGATYPEHDYKDVPLTRDALEKLLARAARDGQHRMRVSAVAWLPGTILGPYDGLGTRDGDPNDRIPHDRRRSLRALAVVMAWLNVFDASRQNTLDTLIEEDGRRFVRHYVIDFGAALGAWTKLAKGPEVGAEANVELDRIAAALVTFGGYRRGWQGQADEVLDALHRHPAIGWLPAEGWDPAGYRPHRDSPAFARMTDRDAYWAAKIVTSFTDDQLVAAVTAGRYTAADARYLARRLAVRRDIVGRTYLTRVTAVEQPQVTADGATLCFVDLALRRGAARAAEVVYDWEVQDDRGAELARGRGRPVAARGCLAVAPGGAAPADYRVVTVRATIAGERAKAARVHLAWRPAEERWAVVGLERDE